MMKKVITYGTFDLLHYGHIRLLERAKALGDYLIVAVTSEDFDRARGKINVRQSLAERMEAVRATGLADEIIVEEYEGQKIDDIRQKDISVFTVGSDWEGQFDYLREYCEVVYLDRTEGISSTELRTGDDSVRLGIVGHSTNAKKITDEAQFVNGLDASYVYDEKEDFADFLRKVDAIYLYAPLSSHSEKIEAAIANGKHILVESPVSYSALETLALFQKAKDHDIVLMEALKTAFSTAYGRLINLIKSGKIGTVYSVDATCTSLRQISGNEPGSLEDWGPTALLPIFDLLGTEYIGKNIYTHLENVSEEKGTSDTESKDGFTKIDFRYPNAVATVKVGKTVKSEGELVISGTKGYAYVPSPWWKTEFFEIRYEDERENERHFYRLDGEGIRYELVHFLNAIRKNHSSDTIDPKISAAISNIMKAYRDGDYQKI